MVVFFGFRSGDITQVRQAMTRVNPWWLLGGLGCFLIHMTMEGSLLYLFFRFQSLRVRYRHCITVGLIGMYYSSITPAATGGQPMQVFSFKRHGVPAGVTSSALAVKFFCWQCALILLGAVMWLVNPGVVGQALGHGTALVWVGFLLNGIAVAAVILLAISRSLVRAIIIFIVNLLHRLRIVKNLERTSSRWDAALEDFHASVDLLGRQPLQFLLLFALSVVQVVGLMSATYFVYRGFGLKGAPYHHILTVQLMLYLAASFTPLPGSSGAQEGGFYLFFSSFFPSAVIFPALLVWRFLTYYLSIIAGFIAVVIDGASSGRRRALAAIPDPKEEPSP